MTRALTPVLFASVLSVSVTASAAGPSCPATCQPPRHTKPVCVGGGGGITCEPSTGLGTQGIVAKAAVRSGDYIIDGFDDLGQAYCCAFESRPGSVEVVGSDHVCGHDFIDLSWPNFSDFCQVSGLRGDDTIFSLSEVDASGAECFIFGGSDDDYIYMAVGGRALANDGDDTVEAGDFSILSFGGRGDDTIRGSSAGDVLYGDEGRDFIHGHEGNDHIEGGDDDDLIRGGVGDDDLFGDDGWDTMFGGPGQDEMEGGPGNDLLDGGGGADAMDGGWNDDCMHGGDNPGFPVPVGDVLEGGWGDDFLDGGDGPLDHAIDTSGDNICFAEIEVCPPPANPTGAGPEECGQPVLDSVPVDVPKECEQPDYAELPPSNP